MAWEDVVGLELVKRIWQAHLSSGQVAAAYLLAGLDGIGKKRLALELAKTLTCTQAASQACDACQSCGQVTRGTHPDVHVITPSSASDQIKIQDMRTLLGRIGLRPFSSRFQVAIIAGAERLTEEAANSLLKSLEEPSAYTRFILISGHLGQCLPTIVSRCQVIRCAPLAVEQVAQLAAQQSGCAPEIAHAAARQSQGSVAAALAIAKRWDDRSSVQETLARSPREWITASLPERRQEVIELLDGMLDQLRARAVAKIGGDSGCDDYVDTAFALIELRDSVEHFVNPKLVANLAREKWLALAE